MPKKNNDERREKYVSVDREVHHDFKAYCAGSGEFMIDLANRALINEMLKEGFQMQLTPETYGVQSQAKTSTHQVSHHQNNTNNQNNKENI